MKKWPIILLSLLTVVFAKSMQAQENELKSSGRLGVGGEMVGMLSVNQENIDWQPAWGVDAGYDFQNWGLAVESRFWQESSQQAALKVYHSNQQMLFWLRAQRVVFARALSFVQLGSGLRWGTVKNELAQERVSLRQSNELVHALGLGVAWRVLSEWRLEATLKLLKTQTRLSAETNASLALQYLF